MGKRSRRINRENRQRKQANESLAAFAAGSKVAARSMKEMSEASRKVSAAASNYKEQSARTLDRFALEGLTVAELRDKCDLYDIKTTTKTRKGEMIEMLAGR